MSRTQEKYDKIMELAEELGKKLSDQVDEVLVSDKTVDSALETLMDNLAVSGKWKVCYLHTAMTKYLKR